jgi:hypothetical protein
MAAVPSASTVAARAYLGNRLSHSICTRIDDRGCAGGIQASAITGAGAPLTRMIGPSDMAANPGLSE